MNNIINLRDTECDILVLLKRAGDINHYLDIRYQ